MTHEPDHHASLGEMYSDYFLDYASYVILERAVPHLADGLKPVQRRILHAMDEIDDGRYNKVAGIVGNTMNYHPHGDASISAAIVQLGQKELLIDTQGNWGNTLTGDGAAAPRYIEARLTPLAKDILFNPKTTSWLPSYDGRRKEPETLPVKFPLLLAQGVEGIAVGLACKILPHNFNELIEASIAALRKEKFELLPDFPTGGIMDASDYRDGLRGGKIRVRAKISIEKKLLRITEIPFGTTTSGLMDSVVAAAEKGKIKIAKIEDNTAANADILVHLSAGADPETTRDALFAFTDCELSISPNSCVITEGKPQFMAVSEILKRTAEQTRDLLGRELEILLAELAEKWHFSSLEKIFIEKRIYRDIEECETWEAVIEAIDKGLKPYKKLFKREITEEDIVRLTEIKIKRISKYDSFKADEQIKALEDKIEEAEKNLKNLTRYTISWYKELGKKYGKGRERRTVIDSFEKVDRVQVVAATETLYLDAKNGFAGYGLKRDGEPVEKCSTIDDIIAFTQEGKMKVVKVAEKVFVGQKPMRVAVFRKEEDLIYTMIYRDGKQGTVFAKRFKVGGVTRDKEYDLANGSPGSRVLYFAVHRTEEESNQQMLLVHLKSGLRIRNLVRPLHFAEFGVKSRSSKGNIVTKHGVEKIVRAPKDYDAEAGA